MSEQRKVRCHRCKEFYEYNKGLPPECCPKCAAEKGDQIQLLLDTVRANKGINAMKLHDITGIPIEVIIKAIDDDLLKVLDDEEKARSLIALKLKNLGGKR